MKEGLEEFLRRIEEKPTNETLIDRFVSLVLEEDILDRVLYLKKLVGLLLNLNPYVALKIAALELQEARKERLNKEYEIGALKDVESCFLKLDKSDNAQLVREEISKLMIENSRVQVRHSPEQDISPNAQDPMVDRKAKLHFRLPQNSAEEETAIGEVQPEFPQEKRPPVPADSQEGRRSALQISAIGVGPNLLDSKRPDEKQKLRNAASLFDKNDSFSQVDEDDVGQATIMLDDLEEPQRLSGNIIAESQQLHFPEQTQNLSMTNRYKTALAKPMDALRAQAPAPMPQKPNEERAFGNPYGDEETGLRETRPLFPQQDNDPTAILDALTTPAAAVPVEAKASGRPKSVPSPAQEPPAKPSQALPDQLPSAVSSSREQRWEMLRDRLLLASGIQIDRKLAQEYLQKQLGLEPASEGFRRVTNILQEASTGPFSQQLKHRINVWLFEDMDPRVLHQIWIGMRMEADAPLFLEAYISELCQGHEYRRAFHVIRDLATQGMSMEWAKTSYNCLVSIWDKLPVRSWYWSEVEGLEALREKIRRREDIPASSVLAHSRLAAKR